MESSRGRNAAQLVFCCSLLFCLLFFFSILQQDQKNFKTYRKSGCKHYTMLSQIFNPTTATGKLHYASTQVPPTEEEERELESEFLSGGAQSSEQVGQKRAASDTSGERRAKKETRYEKFEACLDMWSSSLSARAKMLEAKTQSKNKSVTSPESDPYSVENVMDLLESVEDVSSNSYNKALIHFHDPIWRRMFVKMSPLRRKEWLKSLE